MNKGLSLKSLHKITPLATKTLQKYAKHYVFGAVIVVLLVYILLVFKISSLAKAEPEQGQAGKNVTLIPRVDQKAINKIQSLEDNNAQIHSLFEQARNNPFNE